MQKMIAVALASMTLAGCGGVRPTNAVVVPTTNVMARAAVTNPTALQKHVMFFDANQDGMVSISETRAGFERLGVSGLGSVAAAVLVHAGLFKASENFKLSVAKIQKGKHKSDTGIYDENGQYVPAAFDRMWTFDVDHSGSLSWTELKAMMAANKNDGPGGVASRAEFGLLLRLGADTTVREQGQEVPALSRARLQAFYDGTLLYQIAADRKTSSKPKLVNEPLPQ